ncbi:MAG: PEP-CTERM sorting domain-containing protein, partial [Luteolibacter sp.]
LSAASASAAGTAITSVTLSGSFITSLTVGSEVYLDSQLTPGTSSGGTRDGNVTDLNTITDIDDFNLLNGFSMAGTPSTNFWTTSNFGGLGNYTDTNGTGFDFFVFERGGNDTLSARALYSIDNGVTFILGNQALISTSNAGATPEWGGAVVPPSMVPFQFSGQGTFGTGFRITDLLDASGNALTNSAIIQNIRFIAPSLDPLVVLAVVPEPSAMILSGFATLCLLARRSRKVS